MPGPHPHTRSLPPSFTCGNFGTSCPATTPTCASLRSPPDPSTPVTELCGGSLASLAGLVVGVTQLEEIRWIELGRGCELPQSGQHIKTSVLKFEQGFVERPHLVHSEDAPRLELRGPVGDRCGDRRVCGPLVEPPHHQPMLFSLPHTSGQHLASISMESPLDSVSGY